MKRYVRPSIWLGTLLGCWGVFTIGFSGVQNYTEVVVLRFFIGMSTHKTEAYCVVVILTNNHKASSKQASFPGSSISCMFFLSSIWVEYFANGPTVQCGTPLKSDLCG